jgi:hypothetical protein
MKGVATDIGTIHFVGIGGIGMSGIAVARRFGPSAVPCAARRILQRRRVETQLLHLLGEFYGPVGKAQRKTNLAGAGA